METVTIVDTLRRSRLIDVVLAKVFAPDEKSSPSDLKDELECKMMMGVRIVRIFKINKIDCRLFA